jgi:ElaB/YqjD/DUF883 family membrane-anchored ribosome-binding protein
MESTTKNQSQSSHSAAAKMATANAAESGQNIAATVSEAVHAVREQVGERGAEVLEQAKQKVSDAYEQTTKNVTEQYEKAIDYGRENPGTTALIALGIGVGIGVLLAGSLGGSRSRRSRFAEPVLETVSTLARALFR